MLPASSLKLSRRFCYSRYVLDSMAKFYRNSYEDVICFWSCMGLRGECGRKVGTVSAEGPFLPVGP